MQRPLNSGGRYRGRGCNMTLSFSVGATLFLKFLKLSETETAQKKGPTTRNTDMKTVGMRYSGLRGVGVRLLSCMGSV